MKFLLLGFLVAATYGATLPSTPQVAMDWDRSGRVVGGEPADISEAPWQTAMLFSRTGLLFSQSCGGSIISSTVVVCAAHCADGSTAAMWRVRAGSTLSMSGGQLLNVARHVMHAQYNGNTIDYDISLYFLEAPLEINGVTTRPIPLPIQDAAVADNSPSLVTGWGSTREGGSTVSSLQKVTIPIVNQEVCATAYTGFNPITARMICAGLLETGGQDACQGDSGGPLAIDGVLIGVTSWGRGCARPGFPGVWARVPVFVDWINQQTALQAIRRQ